MSSPVVLFQKMTRDRSKIRFLLIGPCRPKSILNRLCKAKTCFLYPKSNKTSTAPPLLPHNGMHAILENNIWGLTWTKNHVNTTFGSEHNSLKVKKSWFFFILSNLTDFENQKFEPGIVKIALFLNPFQGF